MATLPLDEPLTDAERDFLAAHLGLIRAAVGPLGSGPDDRDDKCQEGFLGLVVALRRLAPGEDFAVKARHWVRYLTLRAAWAHGSTLTVKPKPRRRAAAFLEAWRRLGPGATFDDACEATGLTIPWRRVRLLQTLAAIDCHGTGGDRHETPGRSPDPAAESERVEDARRVAEAFAALPAALAEARPNARKPSPAAELLALRYGLFGRPETPVREVAKARGLTTGHVRVIEASGIEQLRRLLGGP